jgi:TrmH family RNA methyltransferase
MIMVQKVKGQKDPIMKLLRALHNEAGRRKNGLYVAEGLELVRRAIDFGAQVRSLILTETFLASAEGGHIVDKAASAGIEVVSTTSGLLGKMLQAKPTPVCLAMVKRDIASLEDVLGTHTSLALMVEHGENVDNLGMALRSCDASGVDGVVLAADTVDPYNRRTVRGSRGAVFSLPIAVAVDPGTAIAHARAIGLQVIGSSASAAKDYYDVDYTVPTIIVVGNEHVGISSAVREMCDTLVRIPMLGKIHSLNIAVAASVLLYEAVRQRRN